MQISQAVKIAMHFAYGLARMFIRRHQSDLNVRVRQKQTQQLRPAVTRTAKNGNIQHKKNVRCQMLDVRT